MLHCYNCDLILTNTKCICCNRYVCHICAINEKDNKQNHICKCLCCMNQFKFYHQSIYNERKQKGIIEK